MKKFFKIGKYEQWIGDGDWNCTCMDFVMRHVHKHPVGICKHIQEVLDGQNKKTDNRTEENTE